MVDTQIARLAGRRIWDSRGRPTVEVDVVLASGAWGRGVAPAGASCGSGEALELRDGGTELGGMGVRRALAAVKEATARLTGMDAADQRGIDAALIGIDGTTNFSRLGGNTAIAISSATLQAAAAAAGEPLWRHLANQSGHEPVLPLPEIQIFGGGAHAGGRTDIQDFMIMVPGADSFDEALRITADVYRAAGALMAERGGLAGVADEGGWWPSFQSNEEALEVLTRAIERAGEQPGERVVISLDIAATQFWQGDHYRLALDDRRLDAGALIALIEGWIGRFPIVAVEDPVAEDDDAGFRAAMAAFGKRVQVIGDDFLTTSAARVRAASDACNAALIKGNQAGTWSAAHDAFAAAQAQGWRSIVSARSGETEDVIISHIAVGWAAGQLKVGSFARGERTAKWNECLRIAEVIGLDARYAGGKPLAGTWWGADGTAAASKEIV